MKWIKLDSKKSPAFKEDVLVIDDAGQWSKGHLREKSETPDGMKYSFHSYATGEIVTNVTHYMKIEIPSNEKAPA